MDTENTNFHRAREKTYSLGTFKYVESAYSLRRGVVPDGSIISVVLTGALGIAENLGREKLTNGVSRRSEKSCDKVP